MLEKYQSATGLFPRHDHYLHSRSRDPSFRNILHRFWHLHHARLVLDQHPNLDLGFCSNVLETYLESFRSETNLANLNVMFDGV